MSDLPLRLAKVALLLTAGASLLGFLARYGWLFELLSHFRVQYAAILSLGAALMGLTGELLTAALLGAAGLVNLRAVSPFLPWRKVAGTDQPLKLVLINVRMRNRNFGQTARLLAEQDPDFIALVEVDQGWLDGLGQELLTSGYQSTALPRDDSYGLVIFSKHAIRSMSPIELPALESPSLACEIGYAGSELNFLLVHLPPPLTPGLMRSRDQGLVEVAEWMKDREGSWLVLGDFNLTPWSPQVKDFSAAAGFKSMRDGNGILATWPDQFAPARIPIDHVLGTKSVSFGRSEVGPSVRSDHLPLIVRFRLQDR